MKKKVLSILAAFLMVVGIAAGAVFSTPDSAALAPSGIMNNGLNGIYIDINRAPYTTLAETTSYAYRRGGCAWFASSRARGLTGKNISIHGPANWWNTYYANYGFTKGYTPRAKCFAIYTNHMLVVERIDGSVITVSEGATPQSDADHGYCIIYTTTREKLEGNNGGDFVGYIYLNVGDECNTNGLTTARTNWWDRFHPTTTTTTRTTTRYSTTSNQTLPNGSTTSGAITTTPAPGTAQPCHRKGGGKKRQPAYHMPYPAGDISLYLLHNPGTILLGAVPSYTDNEADLRGLRAFIDTLSSVKKVEVLPYHNLGVYKFKELGIKYTLEDTPAPSKERVENAEKILRGQI